MRDFKLRLSLSMTWILAMVAIVLLGSIPLQAETLSPAAIHIQSYYQQLMPTIQQAGRLSVRERDRRFTPAITSAFDIGTMTRLAVGPAWTSFSAAQQAAVREAFTHFIVADYASQISDYSGERFVVDPQTTPAGRAGGEIVKTKLVQSERSDRDHKLFGPWRAGDRRLSPRNYQRSRDATRRICLDHRLGWCRRSHQEIAGANREPAWELRFRRLQATSPFGIASGPDGAVLSENHIPDVLMMQSAKMGMATLNHLGRTERAVQSKTRRRSFQSDVELMTEEQILGFKPAPRPKQVGDEIPSACRTANINPNDAIILPYDVNPHRMEFSERT